MTIAINRTTLGWNAAAASFAYGFGTLSAFGYKIVGADQLIGGPYPDNSPMVSTLDWTTGQPNAKYWVIKMLVDAFGARPRSIHPTTVSGLRKEVVGDPLFAQGISLEGRRGALLVSKIAAEQRLSLKMAFPHGSVAQVLEGVGPEPGFMPPVTKDLQAGEDIVLGPFAIVLLWSTEDPHAQVGIFV